MCVHLDEEKSVNVIPFYAFASAFALFGSIKRPKKGMWKEMDGDGDGKTKNEKKKQKERKNRTVIVGGAEMKD